MHDEVVLEFQVQGAAVCCSEILFNINSLVTINTKGPAIFGRKKAEPFPKTIFFDRFFLLICTSECHHMLSFHQTLCFSKFDS